MGDRSLAVLWIEAGVSTVRPLGEVPGVDPGDEQLIVAAADDQNPRSGRHRRADRVLHAGDELGVVVGGHGRSGRTRRLALRPQVAFGAAVRSGLVREHEHHAQLAIVVGGPRQALADQLHPRLAVGRVRGDGQGRGGHTATFFSSKTTQASSEKASE